MRYARAFWFLLALTGCGGPQYEWVRPMGRSDQESLQDAYECTRDAQTTRGFGTGGVMMMRTETDTDLYVLCLRARGYTTRLVR